MIRKDSDEKAIKWLVILAVALIIVLLMSLLTTDYKIFKKKKNTNDEVSQTLLDRIEEIENDDTYNESGINIVASADNKLNKNNVWSGALDIAWKELLANNLPGDLDESKNNSVNNLNNSTMSTNYISSGDYLNISGLKNDELNTKITEEIANGFSNNSPSLSLFNWKINNDYYAIFSAINKSISFPIKYTELGLENGIFYYGIDERTNQRLYSQVSVMFFNKDEDKYAVSLKTADGSIILAKGIEGDTFNNVYNSIKEEYNSYTGITNFAASDKLKIPTIVVSYSDLIKSLNNVTLKDNKSTIKVSQVLESNIIRIENNGEIIRENKNTIPNTKNLREFNFDGNFYVFVLSEGSENPYFAIKVDDIDLFQSK